ncbi:hypothetical protein RJ639_036137 [Escallonia herrerae]|uniref:Uncharacterized protein n=1 Tax=Escallonia herrerae TaxID=1293975 RepID=A0AA89BCT1_9ASTE|nr:hypothetical protein RJ639_036137 [Escallonia herrerae]
MLPSTRLAVPALVIIHIHLTRLRTTLTGAGITDSLSHIVLYFLIASFNWQFNSRFFSSHRLSVLDTRSSRDRLRRIRLHRLLKSPPTPNPVNGVKSFDVVVDPSRGLWFRVYVPTATGKLLSSCSSTVANSSTSARTGRDLSYNKGLTGSLSPQLGDLKNLRILILAGCSFSGNIPNELGNLGELTYLALNTNNFTGGIPPSLGRLSNLYWLDLAENQLTGSLPVSNMNTTIPGLDLLNKAKHFHFNKNQLTGSIPAKLFSSDMVLIHVLFDSNQLTGRIPATLGLVQTLEALRLDRNALTGNVPSNLTNLINLMELNLARNNLSGPFPDFAGLNSLNYVDLSNNSFRQSETPAWFSTLQSLTTLIWVPSRAVATDSLQFPTDPTSVSSNISTEDHASS